MSTQNYANHHHRSTMSLAGMLTFLIAVVSFGLRWFSIGGRLTMAIGIAAMLVTELILLLISRAYTTKLQDRIIRLEMRLRCASILTPAQQDLFRRLTMPQLVGLRFASDAELPALLERAVREQLTNDQIKRAVVDWVADEYRT